MPGDISFPDLGNLVWESDQEWWIGQVELRPGLLILVMIDYEQGDLSELETLHRAQGVFASLRNREEEFRRQTAAEVDGMIGLTANEVFDFLILSSLCVHVDGTATVEWDHESIYHGVVTHLGRKGEFLWAELGG